MFVEVEDIVSQCILAQGYHRRKNESSTKHPAILEGCRSL